MVTALNLNPTDPPSKSEVFTSAIMGQSSFNLVSLFTGVLMKEAFNLTSCHFNKKILALLHDVLNPSNFRFGGQSYIQTDGISMGLLLSPMIADSHIEDYKFKTFHHFVYHMNLNFNIFDPSILLPHFYCIHTDNTQSQHFSADNSALHFGNPPTARMPQPV